MKLRFLSVLFFPLFLLNYTPSHAKLPPVEKGKPLPSNLFVELNKTVNPAVVNISTETKPKVHNNPWGRGGGDPMEEFLKQFLGGGMGGGRDYKSRSNFSLGTGFLIRKDGLILTNSHVIDKADIIKVQLSEKDEETYIAEVIGKDPRTDVALIKIKARKKLPYVKLGNSSELEVGEWVAAFGNPFGHGHSITKGIVSAIGRDLEGMNLFPFIQTDASINPGNSGGPLVNVKGEVIGVNTAIDARAQGIGFAIPIDEVKTIISQLEKNGTVERGFLGVEMRDMSEDFARRLQVKQTTGTLIVNVLPDSAASRGGIKTYDIITKFNGMKIKSSSDLAKAVTRTPIGKKVKVILFRDDKQKSLFIRVGNSNTASNDKKSKSKKSYSKKNKSRSKTSPLIERYGLEIVALSSSLKKDFEIGSTGKHKAVISRTVGYSKASRAGLRAGDVIYEINRRPIFSAKDASKALLKSKGPFLIRIKRGRIFTLIKLD